MNLNGEMGEGLSPEEIRAICAEFGVVRPCTDRGEGRCGSRSFAVSRPEGDAR
jgi:hypothetical protein